jgi:hypothetical protein
VCGSEEKNYLLVMLIFRTEKQELIHFLFVGIKYDFTDFVSVDHLQNLIPFGKVSFTL